MGNTYQWTLSALESLDETDYHEVTQEQREWLYDSISTKEEVFKTLERLMKK
jgi:hypothetical protein